MDDQERITGVCIIDLTSIIRCHLSRLVTDPIQVVTDLASPPCLSIKIKIQQVPKRMVSIKYTQV